MIFSIIDLIDLYFMCMSIGHQIDVKEKRTRVIHQSTKFIVGKKK